MRPLLLAIAISIPAQVDQLDADAILEWDGRMPWISSATNIVRCSGFHIASGRFAGKDLSNLYVRRGEAYLHFEKMETERAKADFALALRHHPGNRRAQWRYALTVRKEDPGEAKRIGSILVDRDPSYAPGHFILGLCEAREDRNDAAVRHLAKAIELDPTLTIAQVELGIIYYERRSFDKALHHARAALRCREIASGEWRNAHKIAGGACFELGRYEQAECHYYAAMSLGASDKGQMHALIWDVHYMRGRPALCLKVSRNEVRQVDADAKSFHRYGRALMHFGRYDEAKPYLEKALEADPDDQLFLGTMAMLQEREGHFKEARARYKKAMNGRGSVSVSLIIHCALLLAACPDEEVSDPEEALRLIEMMLARYKYRPGAMKTVLAVKAIAQARMGDYDDACDTLRQARAIHGRGTDGQWGKGLLQLFLQRKPFTRNHRGPADEMLFDIKPLDPIY